MNPRDLDLDLIDELRRAGGADAIEVFAKRGRSRRFIEEGGRETQAEAAEQGWAVRASAGRGSFFAAGTGDPRSARWPQPDGFPLALPPARDAPDWQAPASSEAPLASESELRLLATALRRELAALEPDASLDFLALEDGQSESRIGSSSGILVGWRTRLASLTIRASLNGPSAASVRAEWVRWELREMAPRRLAGRLASLLAIARDGRTLKRDRCDVIAAPEVVTRLLAGLVPLFLEASSDRLIAGLGGSEALGSAQLTVIDDGRLEGGLLSSPVDGEGTPTRAVELIEAGVFRQPLQPWSSTRPGRCGGCSRRDSWREQPTVAPSHLYLKPDGERRVAELIGDLSRGYYLLDADEVAVCDWSTDQFELGVSGFEIVGGQARAPIVGVRLCGKISALLTGVRSLGRDLTFLRQPVGLVGSPTVRLTGLELRG